MLEACHEDLEATQGLRGQAVAGPRAVDFALDPAKGGVSFEIVALDDDSANINVVKQ